MSEPRSRYQRRIDVVDCQAHRLTRYERFDRVFTAILKQVRAGTELRVEATGKRIRISLGSRGTWEFPTLELGLRSIGGFLEGAVSAATTIEGDCPEIDLLDQELIRGSTLSVSAFGDKVKVCWRRTLPSQDISLKSGGSHRVAQTGVRTSIQDGSTRLLTMIRETLSSHERIDKVSPLSRKVE